jgi:hypothetical protein
MVAAAACSKLEPWSLIICAQACCTRAVQAG